MENMQDRRTQSDASNNGKYQTSLSVKSAVERQSQPNDQKDKKTLHEKLKAALTPSWDTVLVMSCVIAVSVDPLFFYIPVINEEIKCLGVDKNVRIAALLLRTITDIAFILNIFYEVRNVTEKALRTRAKSVKDNPNNHEAKEISRFAWELAGKMPWHSIIIDILAVLPIPQVLMAIFFKMRSSKYLGRRKIIDVFLLLQYLPRIYRMHHSSTKIKQKKGPWIRGALFFFLYILASHLLGAFWYFFSIQRETQCWHKACMKHNSNGCNFYCDQDMSSRNMTFISSLDEFCLVDVPANATTPIPFDFGIFIDSLKSGNTGQINFAKKFFYSFWWGLRNLSNFGTNLETSTYLLENCFAILISIVGLLLFLYLIGNVQTLISMETEKSEERRKKLQMTEMDIQVWMDKNGLNKDTKNEIKEILKEKSEKIKDADMENIFNILPPQNRISLKRILCMDTLRKVPLTLKNTIEKKLDQDILKDKVLTSICDYLKPVIYPDNTFVYRMGEPLDRMFLITDGLIWTYSSAGVNRSTSIGSASLDEGHGTGSMSLGKGDFYGDELLSWASLKNLPMLKANVKAHGKVEGFILMARDLKVVVDRYKTHWVFSDPQVEKEAATESIQKVYRQLKQQPKKDQPKVPHPEHQKVPDVPPTSEVKVSLPQSTSIVVDVRSEDAKTATSLVP